MTVSKQLHCLLSSMCRRMFLQISGGALLTTTRGHCGSVPHSPVPCCRRRAAVPGSGEADDLATEVVDDMEGRRSGWACWDTLSFPCPDLAPPVSPWLGLEVALPAKPPPRAELVFLSGQRFWMCDTASSATMPPPAVTRSVACTVKSWVSSAHRSVTRHSYTPSSSFFTLDRLRRWEMALPCTRTVWKWGRAKDGNSLKNWQTF